MKIIWNIRDTLGSVSFPHTSKVFKQNLVELTTLPGRKEKAMKNYMIIYNETVSHVFYVDADSKEEAEEKFKQMSESGKLDFSYGDVVDAETKIYEN